MTDKRLFSVAIGVALAQPRRGVIAREGDGSILLACLTTVAKIAPRDLTLIRDNGFLPRHRQAADRDRGRDRYRSVAKGAGLGNGHRVRDEPHFMQLLDHRFARNQPWRALGA